VTTTTSVLTTNFLITPNNYELVFGNSNTDGITFSRSITFPTNFTGTTQWVQIANQSIRNLVFNGVTQMSENPPSGLDGCYPYTTVNNPSAYDSPNIGFTGTVTPTSTVSMVTDDNFTMWLMFKPFAAEAIWVPLKKVNWFWNAQATYNTGSWTYSGNSPTTNPVFENTTDFPTWTSVVADRNNSCP
ncbi:MAG TPA: hypothetical protein VK892_21605, partial [Pyrinomonadaceae bacterium]|nr:hypothetical protein [Pyrinomonadaceae bacterium]